MARQQSRESKDEAFQTNLFYKDESARCSTSFDDDDSLASQGKLQTYAQDVSRFARDMFPDFFEEVATKTLCRKSSDSVSCSFSAGSNGTDNNYCELDGEIKAVKAWFIKEYGLISSAAVYV